MGKVELMEDDAVASVSDNTREAERQEAKHIAGADREPTPEEETSADEAAEELAESGELGRAGEQEREMNRLGANVKGEGQIP